MKVHFDSRKKKKCILTFARSWNGLAATRCLGKHGIQVITGDLNPVAAASFSKYSVEHFTYPNPDEYPKSFIEKLVTVAKKHQAHDTDLVLMPLHTDTLTIIRHLDQFEGLVNVALPTKEQFLTAGNKTRLAKFCKQHNVHVPPTLATDHPARFADECIKFNYPAFMKVPTATAAIGLKKVASPDEALEVFLKFCSEYELLKPLGYPILQSYVDGDDYCATFLFDHGEPRTCMTYHNLLEYPKGGGMGVLRETVQAPRIEEIGTDILRKLNWHGVAEIDFRWNGVDEPWLIEINPRFWGGLVQCIESGIPYPSLVYKLATEGSVEPYTYRKEGVRTWNPGLTMLLAVQEYREDKRPIQDIAKAYNEFHGEFKQDQLKAVKQLVGKIGTALNPGERIKRLERILKDSKAINEFFSWDDPLPLLGIMYPLMVFIQCGSISPELLIGKAKIEDDEPEEAAAS